VNAKPNATGNNAEQFVIGQIHAAEFEEVDRKEILDYGRLPGQRIYAAQVDIGQSIYGTKRRVDLVLRCDKYPEGLIIQIKWQQSPGSVDEKFPYEVECIKQDKLPTVIVIEGGGYKDGALDWLHCQESKVERLLGVLNFGDFSRWLQKVR